MRDPQLEYEDFVSKVSLTELNTGGELDGPFLVFARAISQSHDTIEVAIPADDIARIDCWYYEED